MLDCKLCYFYLLPLTARSLRQIPSEPDLAFCFTILQRVSQSFAFVIQQLRPELRNGVCIFYLVLRGLDTVEGVLVFAAMAKVEKNWERLVRATLQREQLRSGVWPGSRAPPAGLIASVPSSLGRTTNIDGILYAADEIQDEDPNVARIFYEHAYSLAQNLETPLEKLLLFLLSEPTYSSLERSLISSTLVAVMVIWFIYSCFW